MKKIVLLLGLLSLLLPAVAQTPVTGRILSAADNSPLPGATVQVKGSPTGTVTDADGYFVLPAIAPDAIVQVSFIGYITREMRLPSPLPAPFLISLEEDARTLGEVVVSTGYQQLPRERVTGSFAQVDQATLAQQVGTDVISRLEAVANSISVDRSTLHPGLMVRGLSTISGPRAPLIVVDNFPYQGDISNINPNDVEHITILKDAAAASIWGTRAGNGVIVITTKKGRFQQPLTADMHANVTISEKPDLSYLRQMSSSDFIDTEQFLFGKGYFNSQINSSGKPVLSPVVELLQQKKEGRISPEEADARIQALRDLDVRNNYDRYSYQPAVKQQYAFQLRHGSEQLAWNLSAGYDRNLDQLAASYDRLNLRFHNTLRPHKNLTFSSAAAYTRSNTASGKPSYGEGGKAGNIYPYAQLADATGYPLPLVRDFRQAYKETAGGGKLLDWNYYPLEDYRHNRNTTMLEDMTANFGLNYNWRYGLSADVKYQYGRQQTQGRHLQGEQSYFTRNLVNQFTQLHPTTGAATYIIPRGAILDLSSDRLSSQNLRGQLGFDRSWIKHAVAAIAGAEIRLARTTENGSRIYGYNEENMTFGKVDYTAQYPNFITGKGAYIPDRTDLGQLENRYVSQFANVAYTYLDRYTFSGSARRDASNLFGLHTNELWNPLWSAGLGWELSKESFYKVSLLPYLKLRSTYGLSGNVNPAMTAVTTIDYVSLSPFTQTPFARFSQFANPDLRWETVGMWNLGIDFGTRGNRLRGSVEYYIKNARNLFGREQIDYTSGIGPTVVRNVASMRGQGLDLELQSLNLNGAFKWSSQLNLSTTREEVTDYYLTSTFARNFVLAGFNVSGVEGRPVYSVYSYKWGGLKPETGDPQGYVDGELSTDYVALTFRSQLEDLTYHGSALPTTFGSLGNTFSWKGFSLTARIGWKLGYYFRASSINYASLLASWGGHSDFANRWQKPGDEQHTSVPSLVYPNNTRRDTFYAGSETLVEKGDHVRLHYLNAAYAFPVRRETSPFQQLQVYANLSNLGILWRANNKGLDPDVSSTQNGLPAPRTAALGIKATF